MLGGVSKVKDLWPIAARERLNDYWREEEREPMRKQVESHILPGMEQDVRAQADSAALVSGEELTKEFYQPLGDVSSKAGEMETNAPLFYGKVNPTLF